MAERMAGDKLRAFEQVEGGAWKQTPETKKVLGIIRDSGADDFKIEAAPSPMLNGQGQPFWGTGGGSHMHDGSGTFVDPVNGSVSVAAHEAAHAGFMTDMGKEVTKEEPFRKRIKTAMMAEPRTGNALRAAYEAINKPTMLEEANAQGVAAGAMHKAGYKMHNAGWQKADMRQTGLAEDIPAELTYPGQYRFGGQYDETAAAYSEDTFNDGKGNFSIEPANADEKAAFEKIQRSHIPAMKRQFKAGYDLIK